ncbi:MAG: hypothetical protein ABJF90_20745, partial [Lentilitoribacter sp.]
LLAERSGYHSAEVSSAIAYLTPEELEPAMQRWKDVVARRRAYREQQSASAVVVRIEAAE